MRTLIVALILTAILANYTGAADKTDIVVAAKVLAKNLGKEIVSHAPKFGKRRVGIFAFGNQKGKAGMMMGILPQLFQEELAAALRAYLAGQVPGKFFIMGGEQLKIYFDAQAMSPVGINPDNPTFAVKSLKKLKIDIAVMGRYQTDNPALSFAKQIMIKSTLLATATGTSIVKTIGIGRHDVLNNSGIGAKPASGRFNVEFYVKTNDKAPDSKAGAWQKIPLYRCNDSRCPFHNVYFLNLDPAMEGKRYKIRLRNQGRAALPGIAVNQLDHDRLFAAALLIDGVNSFYGKRDGKLAPVIVHPSRAAKWILTAPGRRMVPHQDGTERRIGAMTSKIEGGQLINVKNHDHSMVDVIGFQRNSEFADAFVFARPEESIAESVGITSNVGMIAVHFYAERLPGERSLGGTKAGQKVRSRTFSIHIARHPEPVEIWRIFYRYRDDEDHKGCSPAHLVPVE